jgi:hypothetical protein
MSNHSTPLSEFTCAAATPEEQAVLAPIQSLLDAVAKRDREGMLDVLLPDGATTIVRSGRVFRFGIAALVDRLPGGRLTIEERLYDPLIRIDNDVAIVWASYEFLIDGKAQQCGTDVFNLIYCEDRWLIASLACNNRQFSSRNDKPAFSTPKAPSLPPRGSDRGMC